MVRLPGLTGHSPRGRHAAWQLMYTVYLVFATTLRSKSYPYLILYVTETEAAQLPTQGPSTQAQGSWPTEQVGFSPVLYPWPR